MRIHLWEERFGYVDLEIPDDTHPIAAGELVNRYLQEHEKESDSGVTVSMSEGWFIYNPEDDDE